MIYFAYGSNMWPDELRRCCPGAETVARASLKDFRLDFTRCSQKRSGGVADIVRQKGSVVWGGLYRVPGDEICSLNAKEGVRQGHYRPKDVEVQTDTGEPVKAVTYSVVHKLPTQRPSRDYLSLLHRGAAYWKLPAEYIAMLDSIQTRNSDDD